MAEAARILLVDDDESLLRVTEKQLSDAGYAVTAAGGPDGALEAYDPSAFDLVITDVQMPGMDGLALLAELKRRDPRAAVVVMTAYGSIAHAVDAIRRGADDYLGKPFEREALLLAVQRVLRTRRLERENRELRRANEILRKASAYFAQAELDRLAE